MRLPALLIAACLATAIGMVGSYRFAASPTPKPAASVHYVVKDQGRVP